MPGFNQCLYTQVENYNIPKATCGYFMKIFLIRKP